MSTLVLVISSLCHGAIQPRMLINIGRGKIDASRGQIEVVSKK